MAIVFDSDAGTITGLSVGGLPDGIVDAGTVAADVATQAEIDAKLNLAGGTMTGTLDVGVSDTGHDVKFHGATAGCKIFWDESADKLRVEGRADGSDIFIVTDNNADILNIKSTGVVFNEDSGDRDFRVESDTQAKSLYLDSDSHLICFCVRLML